MRPCYLMPSPRTHCCVHHCDLRHSLIFRYSDVQVYGDCSLLLPLLVSQTFARVVYPRAAATAATPAITPAANGPTSTPVPVVTASVVNKQ